MTQPEQDGDGCRPPTERQLAFETVRCDLATSAAGRVLAVLDTFGPSRTAQTLSEISRRAGLSLPTTHRLTTLLRSWGALERDASGRFRIGLRVLELAALAPRGLELREVALPFLDELRHTVHGQVHLGVRDGLEVVYAETLRWPGAVRVFSRLGGRWPLHATGTGLVLLAHATAQIQETVLSSPLVGFTPLTVVDPARLRRQLADVRRQGYVVAEGQITLDAVAVAAPVLGQDKSVVAAIGVVIGAGTRDPRGVVPAIRRAANGISAAVGAYAEEQPPLVVRPPGTN